MEFQISGTFGTDFKNGNIVYFCNRLAQLPSFV